MYVHNGKSEAEKSDEVEKSEQKFDESIGERIKLRKQKTDDKKDETGDEQSDTIDIPGLESEESAAQRRNQRGQGIKILTPKQALSRLPDSLAQLKAGNNSEKLKNVLYSLYRSLKLLYSLYR